MSIGNPELGKERRMAEAGQLTLDDLRRQQFEAPTIEDRSRVLGSLSLKMLDSPEVRTPATDEEPDQAA